MDSGSIEFDPGFLAFKDIQILGYVRNVMNICVFEPDGIFLKPLSGVAVCR